MVPISSPVDPLEVIGDVDFIFISHLHPDHFDPIFLKKYFDRYGVKPLLIAERIKAKNFLLFKIRNELGIEPIVTTSFTHSHFTLFLVDAEPTSSLSIDSVLLIADHSRQLVLINLNDCIYSDELVLCLNKLIPANYVLRLALLPYSGANSFPHTYYNFTSAEISTLSHHKSENNILKLQRFIQHLQPDFFIPFAGKYFLGSSPEFISMNRIRGIPDPVSLNERFPNCLVPDDSGFSGFDLVNNKLLGSQRTSEYSYSDVELYLSNISSTTPQPTIHHSELAHILSLLKHRLSHLLNNHSIILPQFDIIFGLVNSEALSYPLISLL